jgi:hypothetical protein
MSVDSIRYFCVMCSLFPLLFKGSALECYCVPALIPAKNHAHTDVFIALSAKKAYSNDRQNAEIRTCI